MESPEPRPKYLWQKTWPDAENDFTGWDGKERFARIYSHTEDMWVWFFNHHEYHGHRGSADSAREAALAAEDWWDLVKAKGTRDLD